MDSDELPSHHPDNIQWKPVVLKTQLSTCKEADSRVKAGAEDSGKCHTVARVPASGAGQAFCVSSPQEGCFAGLSAPSPLDGGELPESQLLWSFLRVNACTPS